MCHVRVFFWFCHIARCPSSTCDFIMKDRNVNVVEGLQKNLDFLDIIRGFENIFNPHKWRKALRREDLCRRKSSKPFTKVVTTLVDLARLARFTFRLEDSFLSLFSCVSKFMRTNFHTPLITLISASGFCILANNSFHSKFRLHNSTPTIWGTQKLSTLEKSEDLE